MLAGLTLSLFAVDLEALARAWREQPLSTLVAGGGRAAVTALRPGLAAADQALPPARAGLPAPDARALFDALIEDRAESQLHDAPFRALSELFGALARAERSRALDLASLEAATSAYPPELRPREAAGGLGAWLTDPARSASAAEAAARLADSPPRGVDEALWRDLTAAVGDLLAAAGRPGMVVVGEMP